MRSAGCASSPATSTWPAPRKTARRAGATASTPAPITATIARPRTRRRTSGQPLAHRSQQIAEPERLREPATAAVLEKFFRLGPGDIAGDEDDVLREPRRGVLEPPVERLAVEARHLEIADDQVEGLRLDHRQRFLA